MSELLSAEALSAFLQVIMIDLVPLHRGFDGLRWA